MEGAKGTGEASAEKQAKLARSESARAQGSKERQKQQNPEWTEGSRTVASNELRMNFTSEPQQMYVVLSRNVA